jgi:hypothetical protein
VWFILLSLIWAILTAISRKYFLVKLGCDYFFVVQLEGRNSFANFKLFWVQKRGNCFANFLYLFLATKCRNRCDNF